MHDAEDEDLPEVKAGAAFVLVRAGEDLRFEEFENLAADLGGCVDPLQREKNGSQLVAAVGWDLDCLDRHDVELWLNLKVAAHAEQYVRRPDNPLIFTEFQANVGTFFQLVAESTSPGALRSGGLWSASRRAAKGWAFFLRH